MTSGAWADADAAHRIANFDVRALDATPHASPVVAMNSKGQGKSSSHKPRAGTAGSGKPLDPATVPDAPDPAARPDAPRSMPGPGLPISDEEYEALKRKARTDPTPATRRGQEDPSTKKKP